MTVHLFIRLLLISVSGMLLFSCSSSNRTANTSAYYDEDSRALSEDEFQEKWRDPQNNRARWDSMEDEKRVARLSAPRYQQYVLSYPSLQRNLEKITGQRFDRNTIFLLEYRYKGDLCSSRYTDTWDTRTVEERKSSVNPQKIQLEEKYPNLRYFHFFEEGVDLTNQPASSEEYFFSDQENFLRETVFKDRAMCGSFAIIKPNGEVLVYNGESRADTMARHLEDVNWKLFFKEN